MDGLQFTVSIPYALFYTVLAVAIVGLARATNKSQKRFWIMLPFIELGLAFVLVFAWPWIDLDSAPFGILILCISNIGILLIEMLRLFEVHEH